MTKSEKIPAEDRTTVSLRNTAEMVRVVYLDEAAMNDPPRALAPEEFPHFRPTGEQDSFLEINQRMDGKLTGLDAQVRLDLVDGDLYVRSINFTPAEPMPFVEMGTAALRELRFGEILSIVETVLAQFNELDYLGTDVLPYLTAVRKHKRRPGRRGTPDLIWADIARKRIEAEREAPRAAIRYMIKTWPADFGGIGPQSSYVKATDAKVNRARRRGMIEGRGKTLRLTEKATQLLEGTPS